ncbi:MAG: CopG family transcriptional regulator [Chloroflexi bacterium]|nr:CopG family transcriptional regulator [Chloroflexota bacterium]
MNREPARGRRPRQVSHEKLAVSLPRNLAQAARAEVQAGQAPSLSALIAAALAEKLERDRLQEVLDEIFCEQSMTEEERAWADRLLEG